MKRALALARRGKGLTSPNPVVGAVIVKNGEIIAEDYHRKAGEPHAEALALAKAGNRAHGADLYVSLEPCCHTEKKTPPCTRAIIASGIRRVFVAVRDPNPKVSGNGIRELRKAGIEVIEPVLENEAARINQAFIKFITTGIPFVTLKTAMTLDGKIATPGGESKWITGEHSRRLVHRMRAESDAVLTAIGTVKADDPQFTVRMVNGRRDPIRIVIDPKLETRPEYRICSVPPATIIVTQKIRADDPDAGKMFSAWDAVRRKGVEIIEYEEERADLRKLMAELGRRGIMSVMIEGGSSLNAHALHAGIVDRVAVFIAPKILCGKDSVPSVGGMAVPCLGDAYRLRSVSVRKVGEDILIEGDMSGGCDLSLLCSDRDTFVPGKDMVR